MICNRTGGAAPLIILLLMRCSASATNTNEFVARVFTNSAGKTLPYRLLIPKGYDSKQGYPVILYLHGAAGRGQDNLEPLNWGPLLFLEPSLREKHRFFLVVPQCPRTSGWVKTTLISGLQLAEPLDLALELIGQALPKEYKLDSKRRYLTGVSMGGHAVWVTLIRKPGFFAAAVPVCSGGNPGTVDDAARQCPVWAFHSDDDHLVPVQQARDMVKAWRDHGGTAKYTEYTGLKHSSWKKSYADAEMYDWLFNQHLP